MPAILYEDIEVALIIFIGCRGKRGEEEYTEAAVHGDRAASAASRLGAHALLFAAWM